MALTIDWSGIEDWERVTQEELLFDTEEGAAAFESLHSRDAGPCRWQRELLMPVAQIARVGNPIHFRRLRPISWCIAIATYTVNMPRVTEDNVDAFWNRYCFVAEKTKSETEFTLHDLQQHIGLRTNAAEMPAAAWLLLANRGQEESFRSQDESLLQAALGLIGYINEQHAGAEGDTEKEEHELGEIEARLERAVSKRSSK